MFTHLQFHIIPSIAAESRVICHHDFCNCQANLGMSAKMCLRMGLVLTILLNDNTFV